MIILHGDSLGSLSLARARSLGEFHYSVAGEGHVRVNQLKLHTPIYVYTEKTQLVDVFEVYNGGVQ